MSRIGRKPVVIPNGVEITIDGNTLTAKGPKGTITKDFPECVTIKKEENEIICSVPEKSNKVVRSKFGLTRSLIFNMVEGVEKEFQKGLEIIGVGYRAVSQSDSKVTLNVGYSHPVEYEAPEGVSIKVEGNKVFISGVDKEAVGQTAAEIRKVRVPRHYKDGAGIRYIGENVRIKVGKKLAAS